MHYFQNVYVQGTHYRRPALFSVVLVKSISVGALPNREQIKPLGMNGGLSNEMEIFLPYRISYYEASFHIKPQRGTIFRASFEFHKWCCCQYILTTIGVFLYKILMILMEVIA